MQFAFDAFLKDQPGGRGFRFGVPKALATSREAGEETGKYSALLSN